MANSFEKNYSLEDLKGISEEIVNYGSNNDNYIIKAEHLKTIINTIDKMAAYVGTTNDTEQPKNIKVEKNTFEVTTDIDATSNTSCLKEYKYAINKLVKQLNEGYISKVWLNNEKKTLEGKLGKDYINLDYKDNDGLTAADIAYNQNIKIQGKIEELESEFKEFVDEKTVHDTFIVRNLKTFNSVLIPAYKIKANDITSSSSEVFLDGDNNSTYPHSYDYVVGCNCKQDQIILRTADKFAYGEYNLSIRVRNTNSSFSSQPALRVSILSEEEQIGTWNIYPQAIQQKYQNINIPFEHNGVAEKINESINLNGMIEIRIESCNSGIDNTVYFDYIAINPTITATYNKFVLNEMNIYELK